MVNSVLMRVDKEFDKLVKRAKRETNTSCRELTRDIANVINNFRISIKKEVK